jgi:hypothetical protein
MLGSKVRDTLSGFEGIVTGTAQYLHSAEQVLIQPTGLKDCHPISPVWFNVNRIEVIVHESKPGFMMKGLLKCDSSPS